MNQLFAITYAPGPAWQAGKPIVEQEIQPHLAYMTELCQRGILLLGGPFKETEGGLGIILAASAEAANELALSDPGVQSGLLVPTVNPWKVMLTGEQAMASWCEAVN
jgi:uncharacterized protein YciI